MKTSEGLKVTIGIEIPDDLPFAIFITGIEGGINYWFDVTKYRWRTPTGKDDLYGFYAKGHDRENEETKEVTINRETILKGITMVCGDDDVGLSKRWRDSIKSAIVSYDETDYLDMDADDADHVLQIGIFGEVTYS